MVYKIEQTLAPSSERLNRKFFLLCGGLHNRNYADFVIMRSWGLDIAA